jgi:hypothetical protein
MVAKPVAAKESGMKQNRESKPFMLFNASLKLRLLLPHNPNQHHSTN